MGGRNEMRRLGTALTWVGCFLLPSVAGSQTLPEGCMVPPRDREFVIDAADLLSVQEEAGLLQSLQEFTDSTSNVLLVVTHPDFCGMAPEMFATAIGHGFGVGRGDVDNGLVVVIKPRNGNESGEVFIAVGYGLEGAIPDALAREIVDQMIPFFAEGDWMGGLTLGLPVLQQLAAGEITAQDYRMERDKWEGQKQLILPFVVFVLIPLVVFALAWRDQRSRNGTGFWLSLVLFLGGFLRHSGSYNDFSGGGGRGGGGGGFGGFGGGGFGGGGAGGRF
jgi:uncharacterized protein